MKATFEELKSDGGFIFRFEAENMKDAALLTRFALNHKPQTISYTTWADRKGGFTLSVGVESHPRSCGFIPNNSRQ